MCTVTFIPKPDNGFILTSNRDESPHRNTLSPQGYMVNGVDLMYPKDEVAGGTWIGVSSHKRLICLLNGGFKPHVRKEKYRMSRGIIVTDLLASKNFMTAIETYDFSGIEPFTIILVDWKDEAQLYELIWDGNDKFITQKPFAPIIWSSSLLYDDGVKANRESWFSEFIFNNINPSSDDLLEFHKTAGEGVKGTDLIMDRGFVKTKSITQFSMLDTSIVHYEDLSTEEITRQQF